MPPRRPPRFVAWIALAAILLSMLPTAGARVLGATANFGADSDYCSTVGTRGAAPALPSPAGHDHALSHCDGCTGTAGSGVALVGEVLSTPPLHVASPAIVRFEAPFPVPVVPIAAPPRGPPLSA